MAGILGFLLFGVLAPQQPILPPPSEPSLYNQPAALTPASPKTKTGWGVDPENGSYVFIVQIDPVDLDRFTQGSSGPSRDSK
jgi:hypothetical protein